ncbi:hypothetical protein VKT23_012249 [Stygiomarasmius scandens]|uniref:Alpha-type protein kinase domain-containing protein n=1 Tax=Marasmiellus scandens TaxID=2682957 RepID=A0ABR1J7G2_9AGAR
MASLTSDNASCSGPEITDGCGGFFPQKTDPGLCMKCALIAKNPDQKQRYEEMHQCEGCSAVANNLKGSLCGRCKHRSVQSQDFLPIHLTRPPLLPPSQSLPAPPPPPPLQSPVTTHNGGYSALLTQHQNMSGGFTAQMNLGKQKKAILDNASKQISPPIPTAGSSTSADEMTLFRRAKAGYGRSIVVYSQAVAGRKILPDFLPDSWTFDGDDPMSAVKSQFLTRLNQQWEQKAPGKLQSDEIEFCWPDFLQLSRHTEHDTVAEVYDTHAAIPGFNMKHLLPAGSSAKTSKKNQAGQFLQLYLNIKTSQVEERYGQSLCKELGGSGPSRRSTIKRKAADLEENSGRISSSQFNGPPVSTFRNQGRGILAPRIVNKSHSTSAVNLRIANVDTSGIAYGDIDMSFDEVDSETAVATISNTVYTAGLSKSVYLGILNSSAKVFKRLTDTRSPENGAWALEREFCLLKVGQNMWDEFAACCKERGVDYTDNFVFTDAILAREIITPNTCPSIASGVTELGKEITWLIEPRRTSEVTKYSGTMQQVHKNTLPFITMNGFGHFTHYWSHGQMVFVDLQGSPTKDGQVLFDPMVHTKTGNACLGDAGFDGIRQFIQGHRCNNICRALQLPVLEEPELQEDEDDTSQEQPPKSNDHPRKKRRTRESEGGDDERQDESIIDFGSGDYSVGDLAGGDSDDNRPAEEDTGDE